MSTLELIWDTQTTYQLWSWNNNTVHYTAQLVRRIKNEVYTFRIGARGMEPTDIIAIKVARGKENVEDLEREMGFYENQLKGLQGTVVPKCYGFYTTKVQGTPLGCLLLEYCSGPHAVDRERVAHYNMRAAYALHAAGVLHGDLLDGRHFVPMGRETRIVDFAVAVPHQCVNGLGRRLEGHGRHRPCGCQELALLESAYGRR
ncbi:hypothetical protein DFH07DRAFT_762497 [Mycena maculata]|uniref:Protein kinase domain-containing protein n=1 Tax=Mycena maculata TaxID=230809 RepID=A0AAD7MGI3_9AGAR|nr:hypothetical protein DFH07DRAFT_762497 [Mycena maculata]